MAWAEGGRAPWPTRQPQETAAEPWLPLKADLLTVSRRGRGAEQAETIAVHYLIPTRFRQGPAEGSANSAFFKTR